MPMVLQQVLILGGVQHGANGNLVSARDKIEALALIEEGSMLPLHGCVVYADLRSDRPAPDEQPVTITLEGPRGKVEILNQAVAFGPPADEVRGARITLQLDGLGLKSSGRYTIRVLSDGVEIGSHSWDAKVARGRARVRFGAFIQDEQGVEGERRYLRARMPFTLYAESGAFGGYHTVEVSQPVERNFETDPLTIEVPRGYERLKHAYGFTAAVHKAYDTYAQQMFGGHLPDGAEISMSSNLLISTTEVEFDLPEENSAGGW